MAVGETMSLWSVDNVNQDLKTGGVFVLTFLVVKLACVVRKQRYNFPPGPTGLPLVGYLPFFGKDPPATFCELRKTYGDVIGITMGSFPTVVLCGRDTIKAALVDKGDDFSARPAFSSAYISNEGRNFSNSVLEPRVWKTHRKNVANALHNFSNARNTPLEDIIRTDSHILIQEILAHGDQSFHPQDFVNTGAFSTMFQLIYGYTRNIRENEAFLKFASINKRFQEFTLTGNSVNVMPWLRYIMPDTLGRFVQLNQQAKECRESMVKEHIDTYDENHLRDITDGLIYAADHLRPEEKALGLDRMRLTEAMDTLLGTGSGTASSTMQWAICLMAAYPEVQEEVYNQIHAVVGQQRDVSLADRQDLPLVEAVICETQRFISLDPFSLPHATSRDTTLHGYDIPKGTVVLINRTTIFFDEDTWGDPYSFRPDRFITSEGLLDRSLVEQVYAFSMGPRRCPAESLARIHLFLFLALLLQRVRFYKPPGHPGYKIGSRFGIANNPASFEVCAAPRD